MSKSDREIMEIFEAFDLTRCAWSAAQLAGCDAKTVARCAAIRDAGGDPFVRPRRPRSIDPFLAKVEELVDRSRGRIRADKVHERLAAMGYGGSERTGRRAVAEIKQAWRAGRRRVWRPWVPEPGMWLQFDWGEGPRVGGRRTLLFCAWLAWSRFRVVIPAWDQSLGTLVACIDATLRVIGGAPTYLLTDNAKTVTIEHVAGVPVRHPQMVQLGRYYGCTVQTCVPYDPESKGGVEATVKIAKADLVPTSANLRGEYASFAELERACVCWCERVNARPHRETKVPPADRLATEREHLHAVPAEPHGVGLGEERLVDEDQTIRFGSVRYSTPSGHIGQRVWCRVQGEELVIVARTGRGLAEIARHALSTPGNPRIAEEHYPDHPGGNGPRQPRPRPRTAEEAAFLGLGEGAHRWLIEAAATGATRVRAKMAHAVELAAHLGSDRVDHALGLAALAGRFADDDLAAICDHLAAESPPGDVVIADEAHSAQPGTSGWARLGEAAR
ncbi:Integrase catalytic region [Carbonactinospora thermoautotrophica]|uniref:Integrase catalytic region n=2 Tax=Carbonactinospora thermoautotrophica TaxID=1469144 RepID=A0A132MTY0_9ACTN|nr:Integrase catalytic region [Carbonactinospora thermoautotrophica]